MRHVSIAMVWCGVVCAPTSLVGDPLVLFLSCPVLSFCSRVTEWTGRGGTDEPSTGMDPVARRHMWNVVSSSRAGRTIFLTTHLLEEADVLASRIGILVNGRLACLGTPQRLKSLYVWMPAASTCRCRLAWCSRCCVVRVRCFFAGVPHTPSTGWQVWCWIPHGNQNLQPGARTCVGRTGRHVCSGHAGGGASHGPRQLRAWTGGLSRGGW